MTEEKPKVAYRQSHDEETVVNEQELVSEETMNEYFPQKNRRRLEWVVVTEKADNFIPRRKPAAFLLGVMTSRLGTVENRKFNIEHVMKSCLLDWGGKKTFGKTSPYHYIMHYLKYLSVNGYITLVKKDGAEMVPSPKGILEVDRPSDLILKGDE